MSIQSKYESSVVYDFECIRLLSIQRWCSQLMQADDVDPDIIALARKGAYQKYREQECDPTFVLPLLPEKLFEVMHHWTNWQALELASRCNGLPVTANEICNFARDMDRILQHLTKEEIDERFLL